VFEGWARSKDYKSVEWGNAQQELERFHTIFSREKPYALANMDA
jgi:hypothetical protein